MDNIADLFTQEQKEHLISVAKDQTFREILVLVLNKISLPEIASKYGDKEAKKVLKNVYYKLNRIVNRSTSCKDIESVANLDIDMLLYRKIRIAGYTKIKNLLYALDYFEYCKQFNVNPTPGVTKTCKGVRGIGDKRRPIIVDAIKKWYNRSQGWSIKSVTEL